MGHGVTPNQSSTDEANHVGEDLIQRQIRGSTEPNHGDWLPSVSDMAQKCPSHLHCVYPPLLLGGFGNGFFDVLVAGHPVYLHGANLRSVLSRSLAPTRKKGDREGRRKDLCELLRTRLY
jgi:hypothetical protein